MRRPDPETRKHPLPTVDIIIRIHDKIIVVERKYPPYGWALPGGFVDYGESVEQAAARETMEETSLTLKDLRQFKVFSDPDRDPRGHAITTVFTATGVGEPKAADDAKNLALMDPTNIDKPMVFDHERIIREYVATYLDSPDK